MVVAIMMAGILPGLAVLTFALATGQGIADAAILYLAAGAVGVALSVFWAVQSARRWLEESSRPGKPPRR